MGRRHGARTGPRARRMLGLVGRELWLRHLELRGRRERSGGRKARDPRWDGLAVHHQGHDSGPGQDVHQQEASTAHGTRLRRHGRSDASRGRDVLSEDLRWRRRRRGPRGGSPAAEHGAGNQARLRGRPQPPQGWRLPPVAEDAAGHEAEGLDHARGARRLRQQVHARPARGCGQGLPEEDFRRAAARRGRRDDADARRTRGEGRQQDRAGGWTAAPPVRCARLHDDVEGLRRRLARPAGPQRPQRSRQDRPGRRSERRSLLRRSRALDSAGLEHVPTEPGPEQRRSVQQAGLLGLPDREAARERQDALHAAAGAVQPPARARAAGPGRTRSGSRRRARSRVRGGRQLADRW